MKTILFAACCAVAALTFATPRAAAEESRATPNAESCTAVGYFERLRFNAGAVNLCTYAVNVWFINRDDGQVVSGEAEPSAIYDSGISHRDAVTRGWAWAACAAGSEPEVPVTLDNIAMISSSQYRCVHR